jgi:formate dehydrogenase major subunit
MFCEVSPRLAQEKGLVNGEWATVSTARGAIECRVLVTDRLAPLQVGGRVVHQIGLPYHWSSIGLSTGDAANELTSLVADPSVSIQESKALTGNIEPGRRSRRSRKPDAADYDGDGIERDLPVARHKPIGLHGIEAGESQEGEQT